VLLGPIRALVFLLGVLTVWLCSLVVAHCPCCCRGWLQRFFAWYVSWTCRFALWWLGFDLRVTLSGEGGVTAPVVVCNHSTLLDFVVLLGAEGVVCQQPGTVSDAASLLPSGGGLRFVAKQAISRYPLIGSAATALGAVFVSSHTSPTDKTKTTNTASAASATPSSSFPSLARAVSEFDERLRDGTGPWSNPRVLVFPEATTTNGTAVAHFRTGAFAAAATSANPAVQNVGLRWEHPHSSCCCRSGWISMAWESIPTTTYILRVLSLPPTFPPLGLPPRVPGCLDLLCWLSPLLWMVNVGLGVWPIRRRVHVRYGSCQPVREGDAASNAAVSQREIASLLGVPVIASTADAKWAFHRSILSGERSWQWWKD
jgi:1-acyl-sn-glycerol-3-phosphate acyltransferase